MHDVFISYKSDDSALAMKVVNALETSGIPCWIAERNIRAGSNYALDIPAAIREATFFVLILTEKSQESPWVLKELDAAITQRKMILPLMVGSFRLSDAMNFLITGVQYYDATKNLNKTVKQIIQQIRENMPPAAEEAFLEPEPIPVAPPASTPEEKQVQTEPKPPKAETAPVIQCPYCGSTQAEPVTQEKSQNPGCVIPLLLAVVFAFLGFWIIGIFANVLGLSNTAVGASAILGTLAGIGLGGSLPFFYRKKKNRSEWRCARCGTTFLLRKGQK